MKKISLKNKILIGITAIISIFAGVHNVSAYIYNPTGGSGSGVTSITGTANQITASASTGAVTLSLPSSIKIASIFPASDSTTAFQFLKADNTTSIMTVDSTNSIVSIGTPNTTNKFNITDTTLAGSGSLAGSALNIQQTWNTSGSPILIAGNATNTASSGALLMQLSVGGLSKFVVTSIGTLTTQGALDIGASQYFQWGSRAAMTSPADGIILLQNNASNDFNRLDWGGVTSSYPSIKRSTTGLIARLADDSADTFFQAATIKNTSAQTVVNSSTSGSCTFSEPEQGSSYKVVMVYCSAALGTASYTFPTAFTNTPAIVTTDELAAGVVTAKSTSAITITGSTSTGFVELVGY